jgi:putative FmdB family regulatory protein
MPIYEYLCRQCGNRFEYLLLSSSSPAECPSCHKQDLTQLVSLCAMTSENTRDANYTAAHKKATKAHKNKQRDEHHDLHEHFQDPKTKS